MIGRFSRKIILNKQILRSKNYHHLIKHNDSINPTISQSIRQFSVHLDNFQHYEFSHLVDMHQKTADLYPDNKLFGTMVGNDFEWMTYKQFHREVQKFRNVLTHHKVGKGDKVAIISNNRVEWAIAKFALMGLGAQIVPMYEAQLEKDWTFILHDSEAKVILAANKTYDITARYVGKLGNVESIIGLDLPESHEHSFKRWMKKVENETAVSMNADINDIVTTIYTSGTTGLPKGVPLTHLNIVSVMKGMKTVFGESKPQNTTVCFLPWAHVFGMTCELHAQMAVGSAMAIAPNREMILPCLSIVKPTTLLSVPALFNRVYDAVMAGVAKKSPLQQKNYFIMH